MNTCKSCRNTQFKYDNHLSFALISSTLVLSAQYVILVAFNLLSTNIGSQVQIVSKIIVAVIYLSVLPIIFKRNLKLIVVLYIASLFIYLMNYLLYPLNRNILQTLFFPIFMVNIPSFIFAYNLRNYTVFNELVIKISKYLVLMGAIISILVVSGKSDIGIYSMSLSYYLLLPALVYLNSIFKKFKFSSLVLFLATILIIISFGSRGPIFAILVFFVLKLFKFQKQVTYQTILRQIIILSIALLIYLNIKSILLSVNNVLTYLNLSSRSITLFLNDGLNTSGRDVIYNDAFRSINKSPLFGYGLAGDRIAIGRIDYVHNIFLEIVLNFGLLLGIPLIIYFLLVFFKNIYFRNGEKSNVILLWFCLSFIPLLISNSFLIDMNFWILMGFCLSTTYSNKPNNSKKLNEVTYYE